MKVQYDHHQQIKFVLIRYLIGYKKTGPSNKQLAQNYKATLKPVKWGFVYPERNYIMSLEKGPLNNSESSKNVCSSAWF